MAVKRKKSIKQQRIERELARLKARRRALREELKREKKTRHSTKRIFKSTEKRRRKIAHTKIKYRKPLFPRFHINFKHKKQRKKIIRKKTRQIKKPIIKRPKANIREFRGHISRYHSLVRDYQEKRKKQRKKKLSYREAMQTDEMKQIVKDLHRGRLLKERGKEKEGNALLLKALKKTTRRDGVPDNIPVGESPK